MSQRPHIAIVEDDRDLLESTLEFLTAAGYPAWGASSAEAFFRRFAAQPVQVVVLDIGLPGEDGLSVAELLSTNPSVAVIILSARDAVEDRLAGLRAGADRYLVKPVNLMELAANIDAAVKRQTVHGNLQRIATHASPALGHATAVLPTASSEPQQCWRLCLQAWALITPDNATLQLTAREFAFLHRLIAVQGQAVPKKQLTDEIFGPRIVNSAERLNVLLARLRKKTSETLGIELPVKTAHQIGYAFTAPAYLSHSVMAD